MFIKNQKVTPSSLWTVGGLIGTTQTKEEAKKYIGMELLYPVAKIDKTIDQHDAGCFVTVGDERRGRLPSVSDLHVKAGRRLDAATIQEFDAHEIEWIKGNIVAEYYRYDVSLYVK